MAMNEKFYRIAEIIARSESMNNLAVKLPSALGSAFKNAVSGAFTYFHFEKRYPSTMMIEPTNICNGACPLCPVGAKIDKRKKGFLKLDDFKKIVGQADFTKHVKHIIMNFAGETMLNPDIGKMIRYAESRGISVSAGTNGSIIDAGMILRSGLSEIIFSIDGATEDTYKKYRKGLDFSSVIKNLERLCREKKRLGLEKPRIILQFIVMKHNEHEIGDIIEFAKRAGADKVELKPVMLSRLFGMPLERMIKDYLPVEQRYGQYRIKKGKKENKVKITEYKPLVCDKLFQSQILFNGDVSVCCFDYDGKHIMGNALKESFRDIWRSDRYKGARKKILRREFDLCRRCSNTFISPAVINLKP